VALLDDATPHHLLGGTCTSTKHLKVGDLSPDFAIPDEQGKMVQSSDFLGSHLILYFYPKDDTPGCTAQACGFRDVYLDITQKNATVLGVSADDGASHIQFKTKYNLPFSLLADTNHVLAEKFGVWEEQHRGDQTYFGITRSSFVIDDFGMLADVQYAISPADSVAKALAALA